ncbi:Carbonic anhydrase 2 [Paraconexibacter sp. AEG42_29]|uniref:carbonic anhydrase n=1 Tax=Paraconexibacter sp. AEG42_29 TaxID=2997339 RepID=A0AAU7ASS1_9ACTN
MSLPPSSRRAFLSASAIAATGAVLPQIAAASTAAPRPQPTTPRAALAAVLAGNKRFAGGHARGPHRSAQRRLSQAKGQTPWIAILGCADSRVVPELLFDTGMGDVFDARVAGNVVNDHVIGSLEFGIEHYAIPLLLVLGHERCGAVSAAVDAIDAPAGGPAPSPGIASLVESIRPAVDAVKGRKGDRVELAVDENVRRSAAAVVERSALLTELVEAKKLAVRGARYDLDTGLVRLVHVGD